MYNNNLTVDDFFFRNWVEAYPKVLRDDALRELNVAKRQLKERDCVMVRVDDKTFKYVPRRN